MASEGLEITLSTACWVSASRNGRKPASKGLPARNFINARRSGIVGPELYYDLGLLAWNLTSFNTSGFGSSSFLPAGQLLMLRTELRMATISCRLSFPGLFGGIETRTRFDRSAIVSPSQLERKTGPASGAASSFPDRSGP